MTTPQDELRELLAIAFECFPDGAAILGLDGTILYANPSVAALLGRSCDELCGHNVSEFVDEAELGSIQDVASTILDGGVDRYRIQRPYLRPDGTRVHLAVAGTVLRTPLGRPRAVLALCTEVAADAAPAHAPVPAPALPSPEASNSALREEFDAFCRTVSQEFRVPLRIIEGYAAIVVEDYGNGLDEVALRYMRTIRDQSRRLWTMIDESLALARLSSLTPAREKIDLSAIAADSAAMARAEAHARDVELQIAPGLMADADPILVARLLERLFANALRFSRSSRAPRIEFGASTSGVFHVRDNGIGFDMASASRLFLPFVTLHEGSEAASTGTGLAEVQRIVARHGGRVWAEASPQRGATFYFTLEPDGDGASRDGAASSPPPKA